MDCRTTRNAIDEARDLDVLPFEVNAHVDSCSDCGKLVDERKALSALLRLPGRVSAPANFDVVLRRKLDERLANRWTPFAIPAFYMRLGGAVAAIACFVVVGIVALRNRPAVTSQESMEAKNPVVLPSASPLPSSPSIINDNNANIAKESGSENMAKNRVEKPDMPYAGENRPEYVASRPRPRRGALGRVVSTVDPTTEPAALLMLQSGNARTRYAIPYVTVGSQQPIVSVGFQSQPAQEVRVSF